MELIANSIVETDQACDWHENWLISPFLFVS